MSERQGALLEEYINNKRVNVTKLAKKIGMSRGAIYQWFAKKELTDEQLSTLKKEIGFDLNYAAQSNVQSNVSRETSRESESKDILINQQQRVIETLQKTVDAQLKSMEILNEQLLIRPPLTNIKKQKAADHNEK